MASDNVSIDMSFWKGVINNQAQKVKTKMEQIGENSSKDESIGIADMFEMQMAMNQLAQVTEASTSSTSSHHTSVSSVARSLKG